MFAARHVALSHRITHLITGRAAPLYEPEGTDLLQLRAEITRLLVAGALRQHILNDDSRELCTGC
jgi:hypothetical protein